jgi:hypothetical protein
MIKKQNHGIFGTTHLVVPAKRWIDSIKGSIPYRTFSPITLQHKTNTPPTCGTQAHCLWV